MATTAYVRIASYFCVVKRYKSANGRGSVVRGHWAAYDIPGQGMDEVKLGESRGKRDKKLADLTCHCLYNGDVYTPLHLYI